jgi:putative transposase
MHLAPQQIRTFFVTSVTAGRRAILQSHRSATLLIDVIQDNRKKGRFALHEFVIMPNHFHLLLTPAEAVPLEKAIQFIKGGFSFRAKRELGMRFLIWQESFTNHRIHDLRDYQQHAMYIRKNPVGARLAEKEELFPYSSAFPQAELDAAPPWLKPSALSASTRP